MARNLSDAEEGFLTGKRYLIHDRDPLFTAEFLEIVKSSGVQSLKLPPCSPNLTVGTPVGLVRRRMFLRIWPQAPQTRLPFTQRKAE